LAPARRAVEIARRAGANDVAEPELRDAEIKLAALEQNWPSAALHDDERKFDQRFGGMAHDVMRQAEHARELAVERAGQARLADERRIAAQTIEQAHREAARAQDVAASYREQLMAAQQATAAAREQLAEAQTDAERARASEQLSRAEAEQARLQSEEAGERGQQDAQAARQQVADAQTEADRAKASENQARADADQARRQADEARRERDDLQQRLDASLSQILETRRAARGLIVNLSDVLFDVDRATLKPGAREKLNKLAGILLAYPGRYQIEIEGHTDVAGSDAYNDRLSQERADSVRTCLTQAGVAPERIIASRGLGKREPVASNETAAGRQLNRRVEIVIHEAPTQTSQR
jgi:outer membrane protein OmpA-like peptidoglycan-associated protein